MSIYKLIPPNIWIQPWNQIGNRLKLGQAQRGTGTLEKDIEKGFKAPREGGH